MLKRFAPWIPLVFFPLFVAGVCHIRPLLQTFWLDDTLLLADFGARWLEGQVPHGDYYSALEPVTAALIGFGLWWDDMRLTGLFMAIEVFAALSGALMYAYCLCRRLAWPLAFMIAFLVMEFVVSLRPLGFSPNKVTPSGFYNRVGWVFLAFLFVATVTRDRERRGGCVAGLALALLLFVKLNLFIAGGLLVLPCLALAPKNFFPRFAGAFAVSLVALFLLFGMSPAAYLRDNLILVGVMPNAVKFARLGDLLRLNWMEFARGFLFLVALAVYTRKMVWVSFASYLCAIAASLLSGLGSIADGEYLLSFLAPLAALHVGVRHRSLLIGAMIVWASFWTWRWDFAALMFRHEAIPYVTDRAQFREIGSPRAAGYFIATWNGQVGEELIAKAARERVIELSPATYAFWLSRAIELTAGINNKNLRLLGLAENSSLTYLAGFQHTRDDSLFYHIGRVNGPVFPNDVASAVHNADLVLAPKNLNAAPINYGPRLEYDQYLPFVLKEMVVMRENAYWTLYAKPNLRF